ncbi:MAG: Gfo/Idh/MocA family oxidoreductase [Planctomycetes bacterium]|nr:Gfo/Idh/MocA family oxidoreductase [Planctomycetota bacterium]
MSESTRRTSRRQLLKTAGAAAAFTIVPRHVLGGQGRTPPSEKINLAAVGTRGQAASDIKQLAPGNNMVALCDVDRREGGRRASVIPDFPDAKVYEDFRRMLAEVGDKIDAVIVGTPDHTHAVAAMAAIKRGKHVYCEKPLAHSVGEIRALMKAAQEHKVVTQMGNQGHSFETIRVFCEWIWDGAIGNVHTVHCGCNFINSALSASSRWAEKSARPELSRLDEKEEVPAGLNWDLWLGPAQQRPYHSFYLPGSWRRWTAFGSGTIGDWICHVADPVFWALDLGAPQSIAAQAKDYDPKTQGETYPAGDIITFEFPAKGSRGPVTLVWHSGTEKIPVPKELEPERASKAITTGAYVYGDKGVIMYGSHGAGGVRIIPETAMKAYKLPPKKLPRVKNHYADWLRAIREGGKAGSDFSYGGPLAELAMLGIIALKMPGTKLQWDGPNTRFTNSDEANRYLTPSYRQGWSL